MTLRLAALDSAVVGDLVATLGFAMFDSLARSFAAQLPERAATIAELVRGSETAAARAAAHHLRGAALVVGARGIAAACESIERAEPDDLAPRVDGLSRATAALLDPVD